MQKKKVIEACQVFDLGQKRELFAHTITKNSLPVPKNRLTFASSKGTKAWRQG
jgi:hypothetical protein